MQFSVLRPLKRVGWQLVPVTGAYGSKSCQVFTPTASLCGSSPVRLYRSVSSWGPTSRFATPVPSPRLAGHCHCPSQLYSTNGRSRMTPPMLRLCKDSTVKELCGRRGMSTSSKEPIDWDSTVSASKSGGRRVGNSLSDKTSEHKTAGKTAARSGARGVETVSASSTCGEGGDEGDGDDDDFGDDVWSDSSQSEKMDYSLIYTPERIAAQERQFADWLSQLSPAQRMRYDSAAHVYQLLVAEGYPAPHRMRTKWWERIIHPFSGRSTGSHQSMEQLSGDFRFFRSIESKELKRKVEQRRKAESLEEKRLTFRSPAIVDDKLFLQTRASTMNVHYRRHLMASLAFGQPLVVDCRYDKDMARRDLYSLSQQLGYLYNSNKHLKNPFHLHFTSADPSSVAFTRFVDKEQDGFNPESYMMTTTATPVEQIFDKDRIVYLSPNAPTYLKAFSPDDVYVIGGIVDKHSVHHNSTLGVAKKLGVRMAKFPLELYPSFRSGKKSLNVNTAFDIMASLRETGQWEEALRHLPVRVGRTIREKTIMKAMRGKSQPSQNQELVFSSLVRET